MTAAFQHLYENIGAWAGAHGIRAGERRMAPGKAGEFDGLSVTMNGDYDAEPRSYFLIHALGSIVRWSLSKATVQQMFDELRGAKKNKAADPNRLERAIVSYRAFETESSEFAVWLLTELGHARAVPSYTNFMRADLEALTEFHRHDRVPVWRDFFARWNEEVEAGRRQVLPFSPKPVPPFTPTPIENQEILQEQDDAPNGAPAPRRTVVENKE